MDKKLLIGWKSICNYAEISQRTFQRYELILRMPTIKYAQAIAIEPIVLEMYLEEVGKKIKRRKFNFR